MKKILLIGTIVIFSIIVLSSNVQSGEALPSGFTAPIKISNNTADSILPQMAVSGNDVFVLWNDNATGKFGIYLTKSTDGGTNFGTPINVNNDLDSSSSQQFVVSGNEVFVVWQEKKGLKNQIYFTKSTDGGSSFISPVNIGGDMGDSSFPKIMKSENNIYVTWAVALTNKDYGIMFAKSSDDGSNFNSPVNIGSTMGDSGLPQMVVSGKNVYITWENNSSGNFDVFVAQSTDYGNTFASPINISDDPKPSGSPQIFASGNDVYVVWMDNSLGNFDIFFAKSTDHGLTFSKPINVSKNSGDSGYPQMTASGNNVYVVWTDTISNNNYDVLFVKSTDGGTTFGAPINISKNSGASGWAQIDASGNIYVIWEDDTSGKFDIYISKSTDGGTTFTAPTNISNTPENSNFKQMVVSNGSIYVVWQGGLPNQQEVLFSKSTTFVPEFGFLSSLVLVISIISIIILYYKTIPLLKMNH